MTTMKCLNAPRRITRKMPMAKTDRWRTNHTEASNKTMNNKVTPNNSNTGKLRVDHLNSTKVMANSSNNLSTEQPLAMDKKLEFKLVAKFFTDFCYVKSDDFF